MNTRTCSISLGLLALAVLPLAGCSSNSSTSLATAQQLVQRLETSETGPTSGMAASSLTAELDMLHSYVDRVLVNDPTNAEAHHCKAMLFGTRRPVVRGRSVSYMTCDLNSAVASAQMAVDLEPNNMTYRQTLANMLTAEGSFDAAVEMLSEYPGSHHPQCQIMNGFSGFTVPQDAVFLGDESMTFGLRQVRSGMVSDFPQARVRIFAVPSSANDIEAFYRNHWPRFGLFEQTQEGLYTQFLSASMGGNDLTPALVAGSVPTQPTSQRGLMMSVIEMYSPPAEKWRQAMPDFEDGDRPGDVMSYICVVNCTPIETN
jgi:hypothetical protein